MAGASKAGYYKWLARAPRKLDSVDKLIKQIFDGKQKKVGYRQIKMILFRKHGLAVNHKRIRRSMKEQELYCSIRKKKTNYGNQYSSSNDRAFPNMLGQDFSIECPNSVYSGDITEIRLKSSQKVYMHMVKDLATREIVSYNVSTNPNTSLVLDSFKEHLKALPNHVLEKLIYHTDQGGVFMSNPHIGLMNKLKVTQSMSRRGNCLDNAPIESFFGHMKDDLDFENMDSVREVKNAVGNYIIHYNTERPQWTLKRMTPVEFRSHIK